MSPHLRLTDNSFSERLSRYLRTQGYSVNVRCDSWQSGGSVYLLKDQPPYLKFGLIEIPRPRLCIGRWRWEEKEPERLELEIYGKEHYNSLCVLADQIKHHLKLRRVTPHQESPTPKLEVLGYIY